MSDRGSLSNPAVTLKKLIRAEAAKEARTYDQAMLATLNSVRDGKTVGINLDGFAAGEVSATWATPVTPAVGQRLAVMALKGGQQFFVTGVLETGVTTALNMDDLGDVNAPSPSDGDHLFWNDGAGEWQTEQPFDGNHASLINVTSSQHHARYADAEAVTAMGVKGNTNPLNHDRYTDAEAAAKIALDDLYVQVAGDTMTGPLQFDYPQATGSGSLYAYDYPGYRLMVLSASNAAASAATSIQMFAPDDPNFPGDLVLDPSGDVVFGPIGSAWARVTSSQASWPGGSAAAPGVAVGAATKGLYDYGTNALGFATNGVRAGFISAAGDWYFGDGTTGRARINDASTTDYPAYGFDGDIGLGWRRSAADTMMASAAQTDILKISSGGAHVQSGTGTIVQMVRISDNVASMAADTTKSKTIDLTSYGFSSVSKMLVSIIGSANNQFTYRSSFAYSALSTTSITVQATGHSNITGSGTCYFTVQILEID